MKRLFCLCTIAMAMAITASAQDDPARHSHISSGLTAGNTAWLVVPLYFENAPGITGAGGGGRNVATRDPSAAAHVVRAVADARSRFSSRSVNKGYFVHGEGGWRVATVELTNNGTKKTRRVRFDFVFTDPQTGAEVLRLPIHSPKRLRAGQTRLFREEVNATKTNRRGDGARLSVEVKEVEYADGSVWRPSS